MSFNSLMHDRNIYKTRPDFAQIALEYPEFRKFAIPDSRGKINVDFTDTNALRCLTRLLLKKDFQLDVDIPPGFLIPTIPQRLNYILWVEDLLSNLPTVNNTMRGIDIGTGPCAIFSILGAKKNNWHFLATESSKESYNYALKNVVNNGLDSCVKVVNVMGGSSSMLSEVLSPNMNEVFDFCLCNPPFYENVDEIKKKNSRARETIAMVAKKEEILAEGGEVEFVKKIISDSLVYRDKIRLYSSMFGKKKNFIHILKELEKIEDVKYTKTQFCQGNTIRWGVAWTFLKEVDLTLVKEMKPVKNKKTKPPLTYQIPAVHGNEQYSVKKICEQIILILIESEVLYKVIKLVENYGEIDVTSDENTWSHQRRKRRALKSSATSEVMPESIQSLESVVAGNSQIEMKPSAESSPNLETDPHDGGKFTCKVINTTDNSEGMDYEECLSAEETLDSSPEPTYGTFGSNISVKRKNEVTEGPAFKKKKKHHRVMNLLFPECSLEFEPKSLLNCKFKIRKGTDSFLIEAGCDPYANRESMHQFFQFLKNKFGI